MLHTFENEKFSIPLLPYGLDDFENAFTVIVGPNGVGKSRLLSEIVSTNRRKIGVQNSLFGNPSFSKIIAISTSPFDKFPFPNRTVEADSPANYCYVGMKGRGLGYPSAVSLIASAAKGLLKNYVNSSNGNRLVYAFDLLGFSPQIQFIFKTLPNHFSSKSNEAPLEEIDKNWASTREGRLSLKALKQLESHSDHNGNFSLTLSLSNHGFSIKKTAYLEHEIIEKIILLLEHGAIRLMDLKLDKYEYGEMSLRRASSGEQCMIVSMLGIAGNIEDRSLILIDEPEISLHPEWQERYVQLLTSVFSNYFGCHFIIATHSPQIVANLPEDRCYVLSLVKNDLQSSAKYRNRSSDFQLAHLFKAPGIANEYLNRIALNLLVKISKNKRITLANKKELAELKSLKEKIIETDPLFDLIETLEKMEEHFEK